MMYNLGEKTISIKGKDFFIAQNAVIIGSVVIENNVSIWYNAVVRGDIEPLIIGEGSNVQEGCTLHTSTGMKVQIGKNVTIGHNAIIHGCTINDNCLIGMGSIIMDGAEIGSNCIIGAGSLITEGKVIPDNSLVMGSPGRVVKEVTGEQIDMIRKSAEHYIEYFNAHKKDLQII